MALLNVFEMRWLSGWAVLAGLSSWGSACSGAALAAAAPSMAVALTHGLALLLQPPPALTKDPLSMLQNHQDGSWFEGLF